MRKSSPVFETLIYANGENINDYSIRDTSLGPRDIGKRDQVRVHSWASTGKKEQNHKISSMSGLRMSVFNAKVDRLMCKAEHGEI